MLRTLLAFSVLTAPLSASAADAFSNVEGSYDKTGYVVSPYSTIGYRFTSGLTGTLTGFKAAINNLSANDLTPKAFVLSLYTNTAANQVGALLGSYSGLSTGKPYNKAKKESATVGASGALLSAGTSYWLVATSQESLVWNWVDHGARMPNYSVTYGGAPMYGDYNAGVFSVQVGSPSRVGPVPEPASLAALGLGLAAMVRRRKR